MCCRLEIGECVVPCFTDFFPHIVDAFGGITSGQGLVQSPEQGFMFPQVDKSWFVLVLHIDDDQGNEREIESSGGFVEVNSKRIAAIVAV